jgi:quinol-cytochrome oxidoreductase complex cytochrome b subunit
MSDTHEQQRESLAKIALLLALGGLLVPLLLAMLAFVLPGIHLSDAQANMFLMVAVGFGLIAEVFAVVLGIAAWQHLFGKVAVGCASTVLLLAAGFAATFVVGWTTLTTSSQDSRSTVHAQPAVPDR